MGQPLDEVFAALRDQMLRSATGMSSEYEGEHNLVLRAPWHDFNTNQPAWFGAVQLKKNYVSYHLMPLYALPELKDCIPPRLLKRLRGKSCFNFKKVEPDLFEEISRLTALCAAAYSEPVQPRLHS